MGKDRISLGATAVRLEPDDADAYRGLALMFDVTGMRVEAIRAFREYLRLAPQDPQEQQNIEFVRRRLSELER